MILKEIPGNFRFFIMSVLIAGFIWITVPGSLMGTLPVISSMIKQIVPVLLLVFVLLFIFNLFITPDNIKKLMGHNSGVKGWIIAIIGGIISSGPIYLWYPLLSDLIEKGLRPSLAAAFLYNRAVKIPLLPMMIAYFGIKYTLLLATLTIIFSIINGLATEKIIELKKENNNSGPDKKSGVRKKIAGV